MPFSIVTVLGYVSLVLMLYLFPDGRFVPRWTLPLAVFVVASNIFLNAFPNPASTLPAWMLSAIFLINGGSGGVAQIYRYLRVSGPVQRQQTKWVVFGFAVTLLLLLGKIVPFLIVPSLSTSSSPYALISTYVYPLGLLAIPLTLGIAVLRYRLWDIDILINRTLVYGLLTGILGAIYAGLIVGLESVAGLFAKQASTNPVVLVVSTLAIFTLFLPLRHRVQTLVDRRFYRRKYDAEKALASFSEVLRNEIDLEQLRTQLLVVIQDTMQPAHASLWLRQPDPHGRQESLT